MKKYLLSALFVFAASSIFGQMKTTGVVLFGGGVSFTSSKAEGADKASTKFNITPSVGFFAAPALALGVNLDFESYQVPGLSRINTNAAGPFARVYFDSSRTIFGFGEYTYRFAKDSKGNELSGGLGLSFGVTKSTALEPAIYYKSSKGDFFEGTEIGFRMGLQVYLGKDR